MTTIQLPRLIDCHVHFREPGFPEKATMASEAASAKAGGIFTVCEMPNTNPPTNSIEALQDKIDRADNLLASGFKLHFFFSITHEDHMKDLERIWIEESQEIQRLKAGCCGIKLFLENSTGNLKTPEDLVPSIFEFAAKLGISVTAHCEDAAINQTATDFVMSSVDAKAMADKQDSIKNKQDVGLHSLMRPCQSEAKAIANAIKLVRTYGTQFHIAHLSTALGLTEVRKAKIEGLPVTCEVTPHHLFLSTDDYQELGTLCKMNPPVRPPENCEALWGGIADGSIDCIATDHAPHTLEEKQSPENPLDAPSGIPGVETMIPLLLTVASGNWPNPNSQFPIPNLNFNYEDIKRLCYINPNKIYNLDASHEEVLEIDTEEEWIIKAADLHSQCDWTPYEGWKVVGKIKMK